MNQNIKKLFDEIENIFCRVVDIGEYYENDIQEVINIVSDEVLCAMLDSDIRKQWEEYWATINEK